MRNVLVVLVVKGAFVAWVSGAYSQPAEFTNSVGLRMIAVEPGEFQMGHGEAIWNEQPVHEVVISKRFYMAETEITAEQYAQFKTDFRVDPNYAPFASGVSWYDAMAFCKWLSEKEGRGYRLPTEAEWEYVCRADDELGKWQTSQGKPNSWGFKNMLAGVNEWCLDWYGEYSSSAQMDPVGREHGMAKVVRGGVMDIGSRWNRQEDYARPSFRAGYASAFGCGDNNCNGFGRSLIGFRVVQGQMPSTKPLSVQIPYVRQCVKENTECVTQGPDMKKAYFRKRYLLPTPPEGQKREAIIAAGLHPSLNYHNHSPALQVLPNGDVLFITYTSYGEYEPEVVLMASRLRFGCEQWDMPEPIFDFPGANDHAPLLWNDKGTVYFFWGSPKMNNAYPFQWMTSTDNGATWSGPKFPFFPEKVGDYDRPQPINTAFRDGTGAIRVACDGDGRHSVLWRSPDNGETWYDPGGRTDGRHTTYVLLEDGSILGMGGKNSEVGDHYMPKFVSTDGGKSWEQSATGFSTLSSRQRPSILRLQSGRLFFATDLQSSKDLWPEALTQRGAVVALSDDEGQTWHTKILRGTQVRDNYRTLGYSVARQGPNGVIHLITSLTKPALHFELNEAWILDEKAGVDLTDEQLMKPGASKIVAIKSYKERHSDGKTKAEWTGGTADDGRYLLDGKETWYYPSGQKHYSAEYVLGRKVGTETLWAADGSTVWQWQHNPDRSSLWTQWWPNGNSKSQSCWRDFKCDGPAKLWDESGKLISEENFSNGTILQ